jgi:hypothetical protein
MRAPKVCLVSVLITAFTLVAASHGQTTDPQFGTAGINAIDADPKPCNSGGRTSPDKDQDSANPPGANAPGKSRISGLAGAGQRGIPAVSADPNPTVFISSPVESRRLSPRDEAFESLFLSMSVNAKVSDDYEEIGNFKMAASYRTEFQRSAGLSDAEGEVLQEIAHDCNCAVREQDAKLRAFGEKFRAQFVPGATVTVPAESIQMFEYRKTIITDHIERLRLALGDTAFKKLETNVLPMFILPEHGPKAATPSPTGENTTENEQR